MLIILKNDWKPRSAADVDELICAELPCQNADPEMFEVVSKQMIHRPCGALNPRSPCMIEGKCSKNFPKPFANHTSMDVNGYLVYKRRNDGRFIVCNGVRINKKSVVPYNPYILRKYTCHINVEQKIVVDVVLSATQDNKSKLFFIDGPGGTGKTFVYNTIYHMLRGLKKKVTCVACSGIAASLLPDGRTVSSKFKLSVNDSGLTWTMTRQSLMAKQLHKLDTIIWDEAPMAPEKALKAIDKLLRDIIQLELPFGGKVTVLGGDFRQVLPVVRKERRAELIAASTKKSPLWQSFTIYRLTENMHVTAHEDEWKRYLIEVGNGTIPVDNNDEIAIPEELLCRHSLTDKIFAPFLNGVRSDLFEVNRQLLLVGSHIYIEKKAPVRLCFSMAIIKSQGQTFSRVEISLNDRIFSHGQLYDACREQGAKKG
ncbi:hypothetical protein OESDEN_03573 [Oesophagostomum dentatum]|uniref:ATP-dependent DNA helicase n=1 Tax=Oesophagostomum dentatum TaxID=61180 RepID=A0A0B1TGS3_OESDE|nr:hypothetical protein OESDEN_03573 [Oesophagostomum dentatum]